MKRAFGFMSAFAAAVIFGSTSVLGRLTYDMGSNPIMLVFLRGVLAIPVLFLVTKLLRIPLALTRRQWIEVYLIGIFGYSSTAFLLFTAYRYIAVGTATVLHFLFPVIVTVFNCVFFKDRLSAGKIIALVLTMAGTAFFFEDVSHMAFMGILFAIASAVTNAVYILGVEHSSLRDMHYLSISFHLSVSSSVVSGLFAYLSGNLTWNLTPTGWFYSIVIAILVTLGAFTLLQVGIRLCGGTTASIVSTAEPITSLLAGWYILNETMSPLALIASGIILLGVVITAFADRHKVMKEM